MNDLTGFQRDCLYAIAGLDEPKGLDVKAQLDEYYGEEINHGRLYPNLTELSDAGYVSIGSIDDRTNSYTLTDAGEAALRDRRDWESEYIDEV